VLENHVTYKVIISADVKGAASGLQCLTTMWQKSMLFFC